MLVKDKVIVITGGASGIGRALAHRFAAEGAAHIVVADLNGEGAETVAAEMGGHGVAVDVADETQIIELIESTEKNYGPIDLFCSNAGIGIGQGLEEPNEVWDLIMDVNFKSHLYAARCLVPRMAARGGGYLMNTSSAAGLLSQIGSVTYSVSKHAAVAFAEWLAITHGKDGIKVSVLCPQAVRTAMTAGNEDGVASVDGMMEPEELADFVIKGLEQEDFLILPHEVVREYIRRKTADYDRWISGMQRLNDRYTTE
jgi:NAD(P)-dependent dehydrogenase (short-subunit alcohol dehydrogenase family)